MERVAGLMPPPLARTALVQEQRALALNRAGNGVEAERVLLELLATRGPNSETYGILGRVYKDRWEAAAKRNETILARGLLDKAINAYEKGFEADWRDAYPGMNAVTLMNLRDPPVARAAKLLPVVRYSVKRRIAQGQSGYWDHATMLELSVLEKSEAQAMDSLANALALSPKSWEAATTARNLMLIREAREVRGETLPWAAEIENSLLRR